MTQSLPQPHPQTLPRIAVLIPCYNEEIAIGSVVRGFQLALPRSQDICV